MPTTDVSRLNLDDVRAAFAYDPETGIVTWRVKRNGHAGGVWPGKPAGHVDKDGYLLTGFKGVAIPIHRLAWFLHHGRWPGGQVDHRDLDPLNNRIANLREATMAQQRANQAVRRDSQTGVKGVGKYRGRYRARCAGKEIGVYPTISEAAAAYAKAASERWGEFART